MRHRTLETRRAENTAPTSGRRAEIIGLVLAESYPLLLQGMHNAFMAEAGIRVLAACADGDEALRAVERHQADVLVLDLDISGNAMGLLKRVADAALPVCVVLLAAQLDDAVMLEAMRLGVKGIVLKSMPRHLLVQCVRKVHRGEIWVEKVSVGRVVEQFLQQETVHRETVALLTRREIDVVRMVIAGWPNKETADKLGISEGTVKAHLHHVYEKLGVKSRLELAMYARDKGLYPSLHSRTNGRSVT
jgi:DNA-binding NarL/FixJ family response regulator